MGETRFMSHGWKTDDNRCDLLQKDETKFNYARQVPGAGINIEKLSQMQKNVNFAIQNLFWYMLSQIFVNPNR